jgi:hypothetical protein
MGFGYGGAVVIRVGGVVGSGIHESTLLTR